MSSPTGADAELQAGIRSFLERACPVELVRALQENDTGHSNQLWTGLAEGGWIGMGLPEEHRGGGAGLADLGEFYAEAGRVLLPTGYAAAVHAGLLIDAVGTDEQRERYLPAIAVGELVAAVAAAEPDAHHDWRHYRTELQGHRLDGMKAYVPNASAADLLFVLARSGEGLAVVAVAPDQAGVTSRPLHTFGHDPQALVTFDAVSVADDALLGGADADLARNVDCVLGVQDVATALLAMEMAGGTARVVEMTVRYVKERVQFGVPIGSFQAVHHHLADMAIKADGARLAAEQALWLLGEGHPAGRAVSGRAVSIAKSWANEAYTQVTLLAHQLHAGMGYVREHDLHLWSQRARAAAAQFGTEDQHDDRVAEMLLDGPR